MAAITIRSSVKAGLDKAWDYYNTPEHIQQWNAAHESWHCPKAENDLREGGRFCYRMEARDGSFGFDFTGVYDRITFKASFSYTMDDQRKVTVAFLPEGEGQTEIVVVFDPEAQNPVAMQEQGWQAILDNFTNYVETH
ncbi:MAG: activator of HSP90 ATPase [Sphingobacteriales bacterium]|nr:MAG: activator of HSP90 ATPase [Sphingobacteriales bacterium]